MSDNKFERYSMLELQTSNEIQTVLAAGIPSCSFEYPIGTTCVPLKNKDANQYINEAERVSYIFHISNTNRKFFFRFLTYFSKEQNL